MKKNPIIFIAMLIALAFTACQMNTDDTGANPVVPTTPTSETEYAITIVASHGTVELDKTKAKVGETVKLTITPDSGYVLDSLSVKTSDTEITATIADDKTSATFTMPNGNVSVEASFKTATATPAPTTPTEATSYKVVYNGQELKADLTLEQVNAYITQISLVETTDYSIDKVKGVVTLTESGYKKLNSYFATNGEPTTTEPTDEGNDDTDNGTGGNTNPPATTEYTVSVADGIKGGHIEVSLDDKTWTKLSAPVKYTEGTKVYVRAQPANSFYKLVTLGFTSLNGEYGTITTNSSHCIPINADTTLNATFEIEQRSLSTLDCEITATYATIDDYKNSEYQILIQISAAKFEAGWNKAKIALGFDEEYYSGLTETNLVNGPKYYYVFPIGISSFMKTFLNPYPRFAFVGINGENFEMPEVGKLYLILENEKDNQTSLYPITNPDTSNLKYFAVAVTE